MAFDRPVIHEDTTQPPPRNIRLTQMKPEERAAYWQEQYEQAKSFHSSETEEIKALEAAYRDGHTPRKRPAWRSSVPVRVGLSLVETMLASLTESRPEITVVPRKPEFFEIARLYEDVLDFQWDAQEMPIVAHQWLRKAFTARVGYLQPWWNAYKYGMLGGMEAKIRRREEVFRDPAARHWSEMEFLILESTMSAEWAWIHYPEQAPLMRVAGSWGRDREAKDHYDFVVARDVKGDEKEPSTRDVVVIREVYYVQAGQEVGQLPTMMRYRWCEGRDNRKVDLGDPVPVPYGRCMFPVIPLYDVWLADDIRGFCTMDMVDAIQDATYVAVNQIIDIVNRTANPRLLTPQGSIEKSDWINKPGQIVEYTPGMDVPQYEKVPNVTPSLLELPTSMMKWGEWVTGLHPATYGQVPERVESGTAIATLDVAGQRRLRPKAACLEWAMKQWAQLTAAFVATYWTEDRYIRVATDTAGAEGGLKQIRGDTFASVFEQDQIHDFIVKAGSTLPREMDQERQFATFLFENNALDLETFLEIVELPQRKKVMERIRQGQAVMRQQLEMMGQMGLTGPMSAGGGQGAGAGTPPGQTVST